MFKLEFDANQSWYCKCTSICTIKCTKKAQKLQISHLVGMPICYWVTQDVLYLQQIGHMLLVFSLMLYIIRVLHIFRMSEVLGPKLYILSQMLKDVGVICVILVVILFAYGVVTQAFMYKNIKPSYEMFYGIFKRTYWAMYGAMDDSLAEIGNLSF